MMIPIWEPTKRVDHSNELYIRAAGNCGPLFLFLGGENVTRKLRAGGAGYKKIATLLDLSGNTVKTFCQRNDKEQKGKELAS